MKRPKFFEDIDRSLSGEPEPVGVKEPAPVRAEDEIRAQMLTNFFQQQAAFHAKTIAMQMAYESRIRGIQNQTATGAMISSAHISTLASDVVWLSPTPRYWEEP